MKTIRARRGRGVLTAAAATSALLFTAGTAHADLSGSELRAITDKYLFEISLDDFVSTRAEAPYADQLDWASDGCSHAPQKPLGHDFTHACQRHDFGYRNYKKQHRFTEKNRLKIDNKFRSDMYTVCGRNLQCRAVADVYYLAVREFGNSSLNTTDAIDKARISAKATAAGEVTVRATIPN